MIPTPKTDYAEDSLGLLTDQYKNREKIAALVTSYATALQATETVIQQLIDLRSLDVATGQTLDYLGAIVGEERQARGDTDYRAAIKLRRTINSSFGTAEDILRVAQAIFTTGFTYLEGYPAGFSVDATPEGVLENIEQIAILFGQAKPAGVRGILLHSAGSPPALFTDSGSSVIETIFASSTPGDVAPEYLFASVEEM